MPDAGIGLISDCPLQRHLLQSAVHNAGYTVAVSGEPTRLDQAFLDSYPSVQVWVIILTDEDRWEEPVSELIDYVDVPVLFGLGKAPCQQSRDFPKWERRLLSKLKEILGEPEVSGQVNSATDLEHTIASLGHNINKLNNSWASFEHKQAGPGNDEASPEYNVASLEKMPERPGKFLQLPSHITPRGAADPVERVVILAASLGGPSAVKEFLDHLPAGLPAAFVYAQHIDQNAANVLLRVLGRHSSLTLHEAHNGNPLRNGEMVIVPVEQEISLDSRGTIVLHNKPWQGPYGPSINQVMLNIADYYRSKTYVILFSGMGNDGALAGPLLKAYGSFIWCQSSASCVSSSMPDAIAATGCVEFRGTPLELAEKLVQTIASEELKKRKQDSIES